MPGAGRRAGGGGQLASRTVPWSVLLAGGGTAGHVEPALAVAEALRAAGHRATLLGTREGIEARLVPARGFPLLTVPRVPLPRRTTPDLLRLPARLADAVRAATRAVEETDADAVIGFGGYVAVPAYLAGRRRHRGLVVHEANPLPGLANRVGAHLTTHVATSHPNTPLRHAHLTGIPLRPAVTTLDRAAARPAARAALGLDPDRPTLLVTGGSQGAGRLNAAALAAGPTLAAAGVQVLHAAGSRQADEVRAGVPRDLPAPYVVVPYLDDMPAAYAAADVVLCRAGAVTCAELAAVGLPAVYVPLPIGNGEQRQNALPTVLAGGGVLVEDADLDADALLAAALPLLTDREARELAGAAAHRAQPADAAQVLVRMIGEAAAGAGRRPSD